MEDEHEDEHAREEPLGIEGDACVVEHERPRALQATQLQEVQAGGTRGAGKVVLYTSGEGMGGGG